MSTAMADAIQAGLLLPAFFFQGAFKSGPVYLWTGYGSITWGGNTYTGIGTLGSITTVEEGAQVEARGTTLKLSGFDAALLADIRSEYQIGAPASVYLGLFSIASPGTLLATPILVGAWQMDKADSERGRGSASITIALESRFIEMNTPVDRRYTNDDQQRDWPGDLGMSFVQAIQEMTLYFGQAPTSTNNI